MANLVHDQSHLRSAALADVVPRGLGNTADGRFLREHERILSAHFERVGIEMTEFTRILIARLGRIALQISEMERRVDRGFGRPAAAKPPDVEVELSLEEIDRMIAYLERKLADQGVSLDPEVAQTGPGEAIPDAGELPPAMTIAETAPRAPEAPRRVLRCLR